MSELFWILKSISFHNAGSEVFSFKGIEFQAFGIRFNGSTKIVSVFVVAIYVLYSE